jgi:hypothetical protein
MEFESIEQPLLKFKEIQFDSNCERLGFNMEWALENQKTLDKK